MKADAALAIEAQGQVGIKSAAEIFNEGSKIHLNDGAASLSPAVVEPIDIIIHPDTLFDETKAGRPHLLNFLVLLHVRLLTCLG